MIVLPWSPPDTKIEDEDENEDEDDWGEWLLIARQMRRGGMER
jgi:hypothetical protein